MSNQGVDLLPYIPPLSDGSQDIEQEVAALRKFCKELISGMQQYSLELQTQAKLGFMTMTKGSDTQSAIDNPDIILADGGSATVTLDPVTGTMTFTSTGEENLDGEEMVVEINATATTKITAGLILISSSQISNVSANADHTSTAMAGLDLSDLDAAQDTKLLGIDAGATVGSDWDVDLTNVPKRVGGTGGTDTGTLPSSGSGLVLTDSYLGFYRAGKKILEEFDSGTFVVGEKVTQATSNATGIVIEVNETNTDFIIVDVLSGTFGATYTITGETSGAEQTPSAPSDITTATAFGAVITESGDFYFGGDGDNYIAWDGTNITILASGGSLGGDPTSNTTSFFDITNGIVQVSDGGTQRIKLTAGKLEAWDSSGDQRVTIWGDGGMTVDGQFGMPDMHKSTDSYFYVQFVDATPDTLEFIVTNGTEKFEFNDETTTYALVGFTLTSCSIAASQLTGSYPALSGAAITALNATQLTSGTVPDARLPTERCRMAAVEYEGNNSATPRDAATFSFAPDLVMILAVDSTGVRVPVWVFKSGDVQNRNANGNDIGGVGGNQCYLSSTILKLATANNDVNAASETYRAIGYKYT